MYRMTIRLLALVLALETMAYAQRWQPPSDSQRCPSKWGAGDQRGSGNHMSRETVLRATQLIRTGEVFELGHVLNDSMPLSAGRRFEVLTKRTRYDDGSNHRGSNEELVVAEIGQVGTQFQDPMLVGSDNSAIEVSPNPDPQLAGPVHQIMLVVNGIHLLENMKLDEIAARRLYEFA